MKPLLILSLIIVTSLCSAQKGSLNIADTNRIFSPVFKKFNPQSKLSVRIFPEKNYKLFTSEKYEFGKTGLALNYDNDIIKKSFNNNLLLKNNMGYRFDPANPWGTDHPSDALIFGTIDYLWWKLFPDK